jgi:D-lyxose ketol-isomerase
MLEEGQYAPMHFHWFKMEDIINRGGGTLLIRVYNAASDDSFAADDVKVLKDGREYIEPAGTQLRLVPGESITIYPHLYHDFEVEPDSGAVLIGEVSMCNDDARDNRFYEPISRFPVIEEDEPAYRLLCNEYPPGVEVNGTNV